jgi:hypothetical protein
MQKTQKNHVSFVVNLKINIMTEEEKQSLLNRVNQSKNNFDHEISIIKAKVDKSFIQIRQYIEELQAPLPKKKEEFTNGELVQVSNLPDKPWKVRTFSHFHCDTQKPCCYDPESPGDDDYTGPWEYIQKYDS